jgi:hypothetical protein
VKLDKKLLDGFSVGFATALFAVYPEWESVAEMDSDSGQTGHYLLLRVQPPKGARAAHPLIIHSDNDEVTVGFDHYHSHFDWPPADEEAGPLKFIQDILDERLAVLSFWDGEQWKGSYVLSAGADKSKHGAPGADRAIVRSWKGSLDAEHLLPQTSST